MTQRRGLTLLEVLAVLAVMGVAAVLVPRTVGHLSPSLRLRAAAREVAETVRWARSEAIMRGRRYLVYYNLNDHTYRVGFETGEDFDSEELLSERELPRGIEFDSVSFGDGITVTHEVVKAIIEQTGLVSPHTLTLVNKSGEERTIGVDPLTGMSEIREAEERI